MGDCWRQLVHRQWRSVGASQLSDRDNGKHSTHAISSLSSLCAILTHRSTLVIAGAGHGCCNLGNLLPRDTSKSRRSLHICITCNWLNYRSLVLSCRDSATISFSCAHLLSPSLALSSLRTRKRSCKTSTPHDHNNYHECDKWHVRPNIQTIGGSKVIQCKTFLRRENITQEFTCTCTCTFLCAIWRNYMAIQVTYTCIHVYTCMTLHVRTVVLSCTCMIVVSWTLFLSRYRYNGY